MPYPALNQLLKEWLDEFKQTLSLLQNTQNVIVTKYTLFLLVSKTKTETQTYISYFHVSPFCCKQKRIRALNLVVLIVPSPQEH